MKSRVLHFRILARAFQCAGDRILGGSLPLFFNFLKDLAKHAQLEAPPVLILPSGSIVPCSELMLRAS
jgi:hypothetical protein